MNADLTDVEEFTEPAQGPGTGCTLTSAVIRSWLQKAANRTRWLYARLGDVSGVPHKVASVDTAANSVTCVDVHGVGVNDPVRLTAMAGATLPAPLTEGSIIYCKTVPAPMEMTFSLTAGGATIDLTTAGSGSFYVWSVPDAAAKLFSAAGTLRSEIADAAHVSADNVWAGQQEFDGEVVVDGVLTASNTTTLAGPVTQTGAMIKSGTGAVTRWRSAHYGAPAAAVTLTLTDYDSLRLEEPVADSVITLKSTSPAPGLGTRARFYTYANLTSFKITFKSEAAVTIATFPVVANRCWVEFEFFSGAWYPTAWGGGTTAWV